MSYAKFSDPSTKIFKNQVTHQLTVKSKTITVKNKIYSLVQEQK